MSDNDLIAAIAALRADLARQHSEVIAHLDAILAALPPPRPPDRNPLGGLMSASHLRTERLLAELQAKLSRGTAATVAPAATVLPLRRGDDA